MFTGIIETLGTVAAVSKEGKNIHFTISSDISDELKIDQSVAHDGVCLTVIDLKPGHHTVTAINETLEKTALSAWVEGRSINLERCMPANGRFDGHIVQGHVDTVGICEKVLEEAGSWRFYFTHPEKPEFLTVPKGSITINGVSLTVVDSSRAGFSVAIIPYTYEHTNFKLFEKGTEVNLEFDIIGKYVQRLLDRGIKPS
jgi:riboflavin synthase